MIRCHMGSCRRHNDCMYTPCRAELPVYRVSLVRAPAKPSLTKRNAPRNAQIQALRKQGLTYRAIGRRFGLSPERVRWICKPQ